MTGSLIMGACMVTKYVNKENLYDLYGNTTQDVELSPLCLLCN